MAAAAPSSPPPAGGAVTAIRGPALTFGADSAGSDGEPIARHEADAIIVMQDGLITAFGPATAIRPRLPAGVAVTDYGRDALILPGFIDCHVHYPQTQIIGSYGRQLLDWLNKYTFVAEQQFADPGHAAAVAEIYLKENLRNGITTACVFGTVHPQSADILFAQAERLGMRLIAGKVMMDRNAPAALTDTAQSSYDDSKALIARWQGRGRLGYAITPRFPATSTPEQLAVAGALRAEFPGCHLQSHIAENLAEVAWMAALFPARQGYLDIFDHYGLLGPRTILGHGIHLGEAELQRAAATGTAIAHCPTSNLFLGSGCLDLARLRNAARPVRVGLATDLGAGTTFSILGTLGEAYKVAHLGGQPLSAYQAFDLATRGSAQALYLDDRIGGIAPGMEADLAVLDLRSTPLIDFRMRHAGDLAEALFIQMTMGDDRAVLATYVAGRCLYRRPAPSFG